MRKLPIPAWLVAPVVTLAVVAAIFAGSGRPRHDAPAPPQAGAWQGRVVGVTDGDTLTVLNGQMQPVRIRMAEIDAPEKSQPFGSSSKQLLSDLVYQKTVNVRPTGQDRYGRTLARVYVGDEDVNLQMVREGGAWAYRQYATDPETPKLEAEARAARRGLWSAPASQQTPPWQWRAAKRSRGQSPELQQASATAPAPPTTAAVAVTCGAKRYCSQMTSCQEARAYLQQCSLGRLDSDGDGTPCEALCRP